MNRADAVLKGMSPADRKTAQKVHDDIKNSQLSDWLKNLNLDAMWKPVVKAIIDNIQANLLPKLQATNVLAAMAVAAILDAIEAGLA